MHDDSILWRHEIEAHGNTEANFKMTIKKRFEKCLERHNNEATKINKNKADKLMNSRFQPHTVNLTTQTGIVGNRHEQNLERERNRQERHIKNIMNENRQIQQTENIRTLNKKRGPGRPVGSKNKNNK